MVAAGSSPVREAIHRDDQGVEAGCGGEQPVAEGGAVGRAAAGAE
jgi:hypothetical protein